VTWSEITVLGLLYVIALAFSMLAADNPFGIAVLVVVLLVGAATVVVLVRTRARR
jgi:hypothetical protein